MKHFSILLDVMSHAWLIKIKIRNYLSLKKKTRKNWHIVQQRKK